MTLDEMIGTLIDLRDIHGGDVDVATWEYNGGMDVLRDVVAAYDGETNTVVIEGRFQHYSGAQR
jgi:hypothetical protein